MKKVNRWYFVLTQFALKFYTMARGTCWSQICDWALFKKSTVTELRKSSPLVQYTMAAVVRGSVPIQRCDTIWVNTNPRWAFLFLENLLNALQPCSLRREIPARPKPPTDKMGPVSSASFDEATKLATPTETTQKCSQSFESWSDLCSFNLSRNWH